MNAWVHLGKQFAVPAAFAECNSATVGDARRVAYRRRAACADGGLRLTNALSSLQRRLSNGGCILVRIEDTSLFGCGGTPPRLLFETLEIGIRRCDCHRASLSRPQQLSPVEGVS